MYHYGTIASVMKSAAEEAQRVAAAREAKTIMLGAQVQEAMATTGVHYLQRYVLRHVVANEQQVRLLHSLPGVTRLVTWMDHTGCHQLNRGVLTAK